MVFLDSRVIEGRGVVVVMPGARTQERDACIITLLAM